MHDVGRRDPGRSGSRQRIEEALLTHAGASRSPSAACNRHLERSDCSERIPPFRFGQAVECDGAVAESHLGTTPQGRAETSQVRGPLDGLLGRCMPGASARHEEPSVTDEQEFDEMIEACIRAGQLVMDHGTDDLRDAARLLLYRLGREIARRTAGEEADDAISRPDLRSH